MNVMSKKLVRYLSVILAVSLLFSGISLQITTAFADVATDATPNTDSKPVVSTDELQDYVEYTKAHGISNKASAEVVVPLTAYVADGADVAVNENVITWNQGDGKVTFTFTVPQTALYNLELVWQPKEGGVDVITGVMIDGKYPFDGSDEVVLSRLWKNSSEQLRTDAQGNEYAQEQAEIGGDIKTVIRDFEGAVIDHF